MGKSPRAFFRGWCAVRVGTQSRLAVRTATLLFVLVSAALGFTATGTAATGTTLPESLPDNCLREQFTLVKRAELEIQMVDVRFNTQQGSGCTVSGTLRISYRNQVVRPTASGTIDGTNRFVSSQIGSFSLMLAGLQLRVEEPVWDGENLRLLKAYLKAPDELGGAESLLGTPPRMNAVAGFNIPRDTPFPLFYTALGLDVKITFEYDSRTDTVIWYGDGYLNPSKLAARYAGLKKLFGNATQPGKVGCGILVGVTLYTTAGGPTQFQFWSPGMAPEGLPVSEASVFRNHPVEYALASVNSRPFPPAAVDDTGFGGGTLGFECSPGIPIPGTPLRWTEGRGSLILSPTVEKLRMEVVMTAPPDIGSFSLLRFKGQTDVQWAPDFVFEMAVRSYLIFLEMGGTSVYISERDGVRFEFYKQEILYTTRLGVRANASTVAANGEVGVGMRKAQYWQGCFDYPCGIRMCKKWGIPYPCGINTCTACVSIPPTDLWLGSIAAEFGNFRRGSEQLWGIKGYTNLLNTYSIGVLVDVPNVDVHFGDVSAWQLTSAVAMQQAKMRWLAWRAGTLESAALDPDFAFQEDGSVVVFANTDRATNLDAWSALGTNDTIRYTNVLSQSDTLFEISAVEPLTVSLISPTGDQITTRNYDRAPISDAYVVQYDVERVYTRDRSLSTPAQQIRYTSLTEKTEWDVVDIGWQGQPIFSAFPVSASVSTDYVDVTPGVGTLTVTPSGADGGAGLAATTPGLSATFEVITNTFYSAITFDGDCWVCEPGQFDVAGDAPAGSRHIALRGPDATDAMESDGPHLLVLAGDNRAPTAWGNSRLRILNLTQSHLSDVDLYIDGNRVFDNLVVQTPSPYAEIDAGERLIEVYVGSQILFSEVFSGDVAFAEGGVYTLVIGEVDTDGDSVREFVPTLILDEMYDLRYLYRYTVDQAQSGNWGVHLDGNVDDIRWTLVVIGTTNPPVLSDLAIVPHGEDSATMSWRLRSDYSPTKVSIFANPGAITQTLTLTDTVLPDGSPDQLYMMNFSGQLIAETILDRRDQLDGSLVSIDLDLSALESGEYHFWAQFEDGVNPGINQYAEVSTFHAAAQSNGRRMLNVASADFSPADQAGDVGTVRIDRRESFLVNSGNITITASLDAYVYQCPEFEDGACKENGWELWEQAPLLLEFEQSSHPDTDYQVIHVDTEPLSLSGSPNPTTEIFDYGKLYYQLYDLATGEPLGAPRIMFPYRTVEPGQTYYFAMSTRDSDNNLDSYTAVFSVTVPIGDFGIVAPSEVLHATGGEIRTSLLVTMTQDLFHAIDLYHTALDLPAGVEVTIAENSDTLAELLQPSRVALQTVTAATFAAEATTNRYIFSRFANLEEARRHSSPHSQPQALTVSVDVVITIPPSAAPGIYTIPFHAQSNALKRAAEIQIGIGLDNTLYLPMTFQ